MFGRPRICSINARLAYGCVRVALIWALIPALALAGTPLAACRCACCPAAMAGWAAPSKGLSQPVARCPHCRPQPATSSASASPRANESITTQSKCDKSGSQRCCCARRTDFDRSKMTNVSGRGLHHELGCALPTSASAAVRVSSSARSSHPFSRVADVSNRPTLLCRLLI